MGPPNQHKLGGLTLRLNEADYGGDGRHPPTHQSGTDDIVKPARFWLVVISSLLWRGELHSL